MSSKKQKVSNIANAILKDNNTNKSFKVITDDNRTWNGVRDYMYWLGMEYYTYEDSDSDSDSDVPYAINCHDVVYLKSKPRSGEDSDDEYRGEEVVKNVIALVIGEKEEYKNELIENTGDDYLHGGFLEEANKIYDKFTSYAGARSGDKVYWITGYGTGGSIANIVADMLINSVGTEKVYCYTFGATNTIDLTKIPKGEVIENTKNASIFNLINIDDVDISSKADSRRLYGREITFSLTKDDKAKKEYRNIVGHDYSLNIGFLQSLFIRITTPDADINKIQMLNNKKLTSDIGAYIASTVKDSIAKKRTAFDFVRDALYVDFNKTHIENSHDLNQKQEDIYLPDRRDGYPFNQIYFDPLSESDYDNNANDTIKLTDFTYSNYTISNIYKENDINYIKFWNYTGNWELSDYKAGDYSKGNTKFVREGINDYYNAFSTCDNSRIENIGGIYTIDGRILAAFPPALIGENKNDSQYESFTNDMHKVSSYKLPIVWQRNSKGIESQYDGNAYSGTGHGKYIQGEDIYKLVDCVFEIAEGRQVVVPFIIIDAKQMHLLPNYSNGLSHYLSNGVTKGGMMSNFTDNRYGQVIEYMASANPKQYIYYEVKNLTTNNKELIPGYVYEYLNEEKYEKNFDGNDRPLVYFDKDDIRKVETIAPIELMTSVDMNTNEMSRIIFGNNSNDYRLVSMRIYNSESKIANAYTHTNPTSAVIRETSVWDAEREKIAVETNNKLNEVAELGYLNLNEYYEYNPENKIVNY